MNLPNPGVWRGHHFEGNHFGQNYPSYGMDDYDQAYGNHDGKKISVYKYDNNRRFGIVRFRNGYRHFKRNQEDSGYGLRLPYYNDDTDSRDFDQISLRNQFRSKPISVESDLDHLKHGNKNSKDAPSYEDTKYNGSDNPVIKLNTEDQRSNVRVPFIAHMEDGRNLVEKRFSRPQNQGHGYNHSKKIQNSFKDVDYNSGSSSHKHLGQNPTTLTSDKVRQHNIEKYKNIKGNYNDKHKDVRIQRNKKKQEHLHGKNGYYNKEERKPSVEKLEVLSKPDKHEQGHGREKNSPEHYENHREGDNHKTNIKKHEFDEDSVAVINESREFGEGYKRKRKREREEREKPEKDKSNSGKYDRIINKKYKYPSKDNHRPGSKVSDLSEKDIKEFRDTISQNLKEKIIKKGQIGENTPWGKAPELDNWDRTSNAGGNRNPFKLGRQRYKGKVHHISKKFHGQDKQSIAIHSKENRQYHTNGKQKMISRGGKDVFESLDQNLKAHNVYVPSPNSSKHKYHLLGIGNAPARAHDDSDSDSDGGTGVQSTMMPEEPNSNQHQSIDGVKNLVNLSPFSLTRQLKCIKDEKANIKLEVIGRTVEYRDIVLMKMSEKIIYDSKKVFRQSNMNKYDDEAVDKKIIFIVHGLTVMGWHSLPCLSQVKSFRTLLSYYTKHLELFDIYVLPMANPDGVTKNHPLWYKNVSPQNACPGVALDRNFDVAWNLSKIYTSSCSQQFPGVVPFSERETQAIREVFHHYGHKIVGYFHVHAGQSDTDIFKGDAVLYPKGYTDSQSDDDKYIDLRGEIDEMMKNASFKVLSVTVDTIYSWYGQVAGTSVDYASTVYGIPYCLELVMQLYQDDMLVKEAEKREQHSALTEIWQSLLDVIFDSIYKNAVKADQKR